MSEESQERLPSHFWTFWSKSRKHRVISPEELTSCNWNLINIEGKFLAQWSIRSSTAIGIRLSGTELFARALEKNCQLWHYCCSFCYINPDSPVFWKHELPNWLDLQRVKYWKTLTDQKGPLWSFILMSYIGKAIELNPLIFAVERTLFPSYLGKYYQGLC